ncbi:hypothetical protein BS47DRAFT_1373349 [Hydnum rufescens UP504]|uniref:Paladin n=1 Tax=Hydnum rufescens UP504 TaxID=1448309 RepID=A0A9P6DU74_9AGAM|nr:hypothetical protein BS47DRAFT_1373349 [Hydnum rufescens UP504]
MIKARNGSVLSRGFILKTDFYPTGRALDLDIALMGAPNFRSPRHGSLNVFGVAQPRINGIKAVLSVLGSSSARPDSPPRSHCVFFSTREEPVIYISGRPFVLRDASAPKEALSLSDRAENLEGIESRLKEDILTEAEKFGGLILTHYEVDIQSLSGDDEGILPTWTAVDTRSVLTSREVWEGLKNDGWGVDAAFLSIPISPDRPIEDNYLDAYLNVIKSTDPMHTSLIFSCGMGAVRTTFAMAAACIIRRKQSMARGLPDPFSVTAVAVRVTMNCVLSANPNEIDVGLVGQPTLPTSMQAVLRLEKANAQQELNKSLLRLTFLMQQNLRDTPEKSHSAIELLLTQPMLLDDLSRAVRGNYGIILSLLGCLDHGPFVKKVVDAVIDSCDHVLNLRENILEHRMRYSVTTMDDHRRGEYLVKAGKALEKYFFLLAFASYVEEQANFEESFSQWMKVWRMTFHDYSSQVVFLRKASLGVFAPVADLSTISKSGAEGRSMEKRRKEVAIMSSAGGIRVLGDEWADHVVKNRDGIILRPSTLLKSDQWRRESRKVQSTIGVRGTINFRNIPGTNIYALGQPTVEAISGVLDRIRLSHPTAERIYWLNLREEPIVYINGNPYCLRRESFSLRNMKDYGGISASRLEILEERLKSDVTAELQTFENRLLLHTETSSGAVIPVWEDVEPNDVADLRQVMDSRRNAGHVELSYIRIPITAERPPDTNDITELLDLVIRTDYERTPIVVNCQLGRGRSTITSIIILLIQRWLKHSRVRSSSQAGVDDAEVRSKKRSPLPSYQAINNLLRVIRNGLRVKDEVDDAIDKCGELFNIRDSIEQSRKAAERSTDEHEKRHHVQHGLNNLRRYFSLIIFQAYLRSTQPDTIRSYETFDAFLKNRPVFKTFEKELRAYGTDALKPLERIDVEDDFANLDEVNVIVANRNGPILSASTILKSDLFTNLQKQPHQMVCGSGMPTIEGMRHTLARVDASGDGSSRVYWTSLREEPVVYIAGRPHVLRLVDRPLQNVEATGISTDVVESMEIALKRDVQQELRQAQGKILLHDELEESPGKYQITPLYETVSEDDIMTPRDVFEFMVAEGYRVDYARVAITDEQAPLPEALDQLIHRVEGGYVHATHIIFNCQMGRGRTTTGMAAAVLISTIASRDVTLDPVEQEQADAASLIYDRFDGFDEAAYLNGENSDPLSTYSSCSYSPLSPLRRVAKRICDRAIDTVDGVQNLRKAVFDYKVKVDALDTTSAKFQPLFDMACNYLYGTLIVLANYLIERRKSGPDVRDRSFPAWLLEHREIITLLARRSLE